jgi:anti-sigma-K factor RskA
MVESYVLGLASEEERMEFEQLCIRYPEVVEARTNFERLLEKQAMEYAEAPPVDSKEKIWSAIQQASSSNPSKIITMEPTTTRRSSGMGWLVAASIILMLVAGYFAYDARNKNKDLVKSNEEIQAKLNKADSILRDKEEQDRVMHDPNVTVINMKAMTPAAPSANVYWDTTSSNVYLVVKNMPKLASDKQYQLWSIIDSVGKLKPTSLGLFDGGNEKLFFKIPKVQSADAFAITIEKAGNTGGPDLKQLQVMGETKRKL